MYYCILKYAQDNGFSEKDIANKFELIDRGEGINIESWNINGLDKPTVGQLDAISQQDIDLIVLDKQQQALKEQKIELKMRIDAGISLGEDMAEEQAQLNDLLGV